MGGMAKVPKAARAAGGIISKSKPFELSWTGADYDWNKWLLHKDQITKKFQGKPVYVQIEDEASGIRISDSPGKSSRGYSSPWEKFENIEEFEANYPELFEGIKPPGTFGLTSMKSERLPQIPGREGK